MEDKNFDAIETRNRRTFGHRNGDLYIQSKRRTKGRYTWHQPTAYEKAIWWD